MPFQPKQLTESTLKGFVDRLHKFSKKNPVAEWPPKRAWAQEAVAVALGFPNYHAARAAIANPNLASKPASPPSAARWVIAPKGGLAASSFLSTLANDVPLEIALPSLQGNLLLLGKNLPRTQALESLVLVAHQREMPTLVIQGAGSVRMSFPPGFTRHSFKSFVGYGDAVACILEHGKTEEILDSLVVFMDDFGHDNKMWKERAVTLLTSVISALVHMRDHFGWRLDIEAVRTGLMIETIQGLSKRLDLPPHILQSLRAYLRSIPGYQEDAKRQPDVTLDQHGYLQMQFTRVLGAIRTPLVLSPQVAIDLDKESKEARALATVMNEWTRRYKHGIIVLDGLDQESALYDWWMTSFSRVEEAGHGLALGAMSLSDLPPAPLQQRLLDRLEHWVVMAGSAGTRRDAKALLDRRG